MTTDIETYCVRYLEQWEQRATVRSRTRTRLTAESVRAPMFPDTFMPALKHELLAHFDERRRQEYSLRQACDFQGHVAALEIDPVTDLCGRIATHGIGVALPHAVGQVALSIATDEAYHAYVAREFVEDARRLSGLDIPPSHLDDSALGEGLSYIRANAPPEIHRAAETMALCFAENSVTGELFGLSKDIAADSPLQTIVREHLSDEGRHQLFFQNLLRYLWNELDEDARATLGRLVPGFLDAFLSPASFINNQARVLTRMGFDFETGQTIVKEAFAAAFGGTLPAKHQMLMARNALNLIRVAGVSDHAPTRDLLVAASWLVP